jgi:hypothetical protein
MKVLTTPEVRQYLKELSYKLHEKDYFGFLEYAEKYIEELFVDITSNLPTRLHKSAPKYFDKFGKNMFYASFRKNKQTTWYAFFTKYNDNGETIYLVRYIANNHTIAHYL